MIAAEVGRCACVAEILARKPQFTRQMFELQLIDGLPGKARTYEGSRIIQVDRALWARASHVQQMAIYAHEMSHQERYGSCEPCTDQRAGALMRYWGISLPASVKALSSLVKHRKTANSARHGWQVADKAIRLSTGETSPAEITVKASALDRAPKSTDGLKTIVGATKSETPRNGASQVETHTYGGGGAAGMAEKLASDAAQADVVPGSLKKDGARWEPLYVAAALASIVAVVFALSRGK